MLACVGEKNSFFFFLCAQRVPETCISGAGYCIQGTMRLQLRHGIVRDFLPDFVTTGQISGTLAA